MGVRVGLGGHTKNGLDERRLGGSDPWGIGLFIEDGAYTTVATAVSLLMILTLVFSAAGAAWMLARAGDVQVAADAAALAGSNVVGAYETCATIADASVLSMGLAGFSLAGVGLVGLLVPAAAPAARSMIDAGTRLIELRNSFAASVSKGLRRLEGSLPFLVAVNGGMACSAQGREGCGYVGTALAFPRESASEFPAIDSPTLSTDELEEEAHALDEAAIEMKRAAEKAAADKERAWMADCGRDGRNMQERVDRLTGVGLGDNPDFESSILWDPVVALHRIRAYYAWRYVNDAPEGQNVEARADAAARHAFYGFAKQSFDAATVGERDGTYIVDLPDLPRNTNEAKTTELYTQEVWPTSMELGERVLHFSLDCPGCRGPAAGVASLRLLDAGGAKECETCRFGIGDVGRVAAASSVIDNGFEYHLIEYTNAMRDYAASRNEQLECERRAQDGAQEAGDAFDQALGQLETKRPSIAPPGRFGCVGAVASERVAAPDALLSPFARQAEKPRGYAVSASALAPDASSSAANAITSFWTGVKERWGDGGAAGVVDKVFDLWGTLLASYGDLAQGLEENMNEALDDLEGAGAGPVARWLDKKVRDVVGSLGLAPVDLTSKKAVLVDSAHVFARAGWRAADVQELLRGLPADIQDAGEVARALGYEIRERIEGEEIVLAEIPLPGGGTMPLTVKVRDLLDGVA